MPTPDTSLVEALGDFKTQLETRCLAGTTELRRKVASLGTFCRVAARTPDDVLRQRPLAAVDGSCQSCGAFPFILAACRAHALVLPGETGITRASVHSPLLAEGEGDVEFPDLAAMRAWQRALAHLEIEVARETIARFQPALLLMDGGFIPFENKAPEAWAALVGTARERGTILVGVIEEVASRMLGVHLAGDGCPVLFDREVLYGLLAPGEYFVARPEICTKKGYRTVFARLARHPQAIGCDFLEDQAECIPQVMSLLVALTPAGGRGIPAIMDIVDRRVRLSSRELERAMAVVLDPVTRDRLLTAHRSRRSY